MTAFLLKNDRKTLIEIMRLLCSKVFGWPLEPDYPATFLSLKWIFMAAMFNPMKTRLKARCVPQPMWLRMPPQEQGTRSQKCSSTCVMYPVKSSSRSSEMTSPVSCVRGKSSSATASSSAAGSAYNSKSASPCGKVWLYSWPRKSPKSASLLAAAYTKSKTRRDWGRDFKNVCIVFGLMEQSNSAPQRQNSGKWVVYPFGL